MLPQQYCLRWRYHHSNLQTMFSQLLEREAFCDVTLACEGRTIKAHKIVLSACSTYFETILSQYEEKDPILIMKDVKYVDIKCLVEFMYKGEINVDHCHLATLLKTAEELRIKGLAEVSWRDEEQNGEGSGGGAGGSGGGGGGGGTVHTALPHVSAVMDTPPRAAEAPVARRKRGRPPIDDYEQTFTTPKIMHVTGGNAAADDAYSNDALSSSEHDMSVWEEEQNATDGHNTEPEEQQPMVRVKKEVVEDSHDDDRSNDHMDSFSLGESGRYDTPRAKSVTNVTTSGTQSFLTPALEKEWPDVVKMNDYLNTGRRQQFWEEPFTKRVMDAIKTKNLEMKVAAELLGVSYGTLYGRYRDSYGCLKHPYRVRDFWTEQGPTDVLLKLKRKEITLFRAAEQLNVTPQTLSNYLISMSQLDEATASSQSNTMESFEEVEDSDEEADSILPDNPAANSTNVFKNLLAAGANSASAASAAGASNSVLANCPDITIIKKEKPEPKVNNNSDHSDAGSDHNK